ncbi:MAG: type 4a pilus biogenesis protein PilO [Gammaproteobacteria bacterium]|nr:type 4a pilus biogenesis protein PilO [Gammaproteobacteria bacterium]
MNVSNLTELSWQHRGSWPLSIKIILCLGSMSVIFFVFYGGWIKPLFEVYAYKEQEKKVLLATLTKQYEKISQLAAYRLQVSQLQTQLDSLLKKWPTQQDMPVLFETISNLGTGLGLTFELFMPEKEEHAPFYVALPIQVVVAGTYQQLAVFLSQVSQLERLVTLHDFSIEPKKSASELSQQRLVMTIRMKLYRYPS